MKTSQTPTCPYCHIHIEEHEANQCLNWWVATHVMRWTGLWKKTDTETYVATPPNRKQWEPIPSYSEDDDVALGVFFAFPNIYKGVSYNPTSTPYRGSRPVGWECTIYATNTHNAPTFALAICRAALYAAEIQRKSAEIPDYEWE